MDLATGAAEVAAVVDSAPAAVVAGEEDSPVAAVAADVGATRSAVYDVLYPTATKNFTMTS